MTRYWVGAAFAIASAGAGQALRPVHWVSAGATNGAAHIVASIDNGWHIYSLTQKPGGPTPMRITLAEGQAVAPAGAAVGPKPAMEFDPNFGIAVEQYQHQATFTVPVRKSAPADSVVLRVRYQACTASLCLPPRTDTVTASLR